MEFQFLPGLGQNYSGRVRAFVLRDRQRQSGREVIRARSEDLSKRNAGPLPTCSNGVAPVPPVASKAAMNRDANGEDDSLLFPVSTTPLSTILGQDRTDPFQTSAIRETTKFENMLLDMYTSVPLVQFGYRRNDAFQPPRHIAWYFLRQNKLTLRAVMQFSATNLVTFYPQAWSMSMVVHYRSLCIQELSSRIRSEQNSPSDAILHAMVGIIAATLQGRRQFAKPAEIDEMAIHVQGLKSVLSVRGGWKPWAHCQALRFDLYWHDIILNGRLSAGYTTFSAHLNLPDLPDPLLENTVISAPMSEWSSKCAYELIGAYANFYNLALNRLKHSTTPNSSVSFIDLFNPGTPAHTILSRSASACACLRPVAVLIYINIMLWAYQNHSSAQLSELYMHYRANMRLTDVDLGSGTELLMWALACDFEMKEWANHEWVSLLARMMSIEHRLSMATRQGLNESLLGFVAAREKKDVKGWWRPEYVRDIVLRELGSLGVATETIS